LRNTWKCRIRARTLSDVPEIVRAAKAEERKASIVPGLQSPYEAPEYPDVIVRNGVDAPGNGVREIMSILLEKKFI